MLSKLMKHEWKALFKPNLIISLALLMATLLACGVLIISGNMGHYSPYAISPILILYYLFLISVPIATLIIFAIRYYNSCYGNEGYLTNTLPVKSSTITLSKLIVGSIYSLGISTLILISILTVALSFISSSNNVLIDEIILQFQMLPAFSDLTNISLIIFLIFIVITFILSAFSGIATIMGSISLGHLWKKHKILGAIVGYVGIYFAIQILTSFIIMPISSKLTMDFVMNSDPTTFMQRYVNLLMLSVPSISTIVGVSLYFISTHILKKKINLD